MYVLLYSPLKQNIMGVQHTLISLYHLPPYCPSIHWPIYPPTHLPIHHLLKSSYVLGPLFFWHSMLSLPNKHLFFQLSYYCLKSSTNLLPFTPASPSLLPTESSPHCVCCFHFLHPIPATTSPVQALRWWTQYLGHMCTQCLAWNWISSHIDLEWSGLPASSCSLSHQPASFFYKSSFDGIIINSMCLGTVQCLLLTNEFHAYMDCILFFFINDSKYVLNEWINKCFLKIQPSLISSIKLSVTSLSHLWKINTQFPLFSNNI